MEQEEKDFNQFLLTQPEEIKIVISPRAHQSFEAIYSPTNPAKWEVPAEQEREYVSSLNAPRQENVDWSTPEDSDA